MKVKQLSIFLENKSGSLKKVLGLIKKADVQLIATTIADTTDYGIFRIICDAPERAYDALKEGGVTASLTDVFSVSLDDIPGKAADVISYLTEGGVNISYLYSFLLEGKGVLIFKTDNTQKAEELLAAL